MYAGPFKRSPGAGNAAPRNFRLAHKKYRVLLLLLFLFNGLAPFDNRVRGHDPWGMPPPISTAGGAVDRCSVNLLYARNWSRGGYNSYSLSVRRPMHNEFFVAAKSRIIFFRVASAKPPFAETLALIGLWTVGTAPGQQLIC